MKLNELGRWVLERQNNSRPSLKHAKPQNKIERERGRERQREIPRAAATGSISVFAVNPPPDHAPGS